MSTDENTCCARILLGVWGESYIKHFLEFSLPCLLAPGNVPALAAEYPLTFVFLTQPSDIPLFESAAGIQALKKYCQIEYLAISDLLVFGNHSLTLTYAFDRAIKQMGPAMLQTYFIFLTADYVMANGSLLGLMRYLKKGYNGIYAGNYQVIEEEMVPLLQPYRDEQSGVLNISPRELVKHSMTCLHPITRASFCTQTDFNNKRVNRFFLQASEDVLAGRFYLLHVLCVKPEVMDYQIGAACDYSFIPEMCPSGNVGIMIDSDDYLVVESQPKEHELTHINYGPYQTPHLVKALSEWTTAQHRERALTTLYYHAGDLTETIKQSIETQFNEHLGRLNDELAKLPAQPFRGHPYWHNVDKSFTNDVTPSENETYVDYIGIKGHSRARHLYYSLFGTPPAVFPWYYRWLEFRSTLNQFRRFLGTNKDIKTLVLYDNYTQDSLQYRHWLGAQFKNAEHYYLPAWKGNKQHYQHCIILTTLANLDKIKQSLPAIHECLGPDGKLMLLVENEKRHLTNISYNFLGDFCGQQAMFDHSPFAVQQLTPVRSNTSFIGAMAKNYISVNYADSKKTRALIYVMLAIPGMIFMTASNWLGNLFNKRGHCTSLLVTLNAKQGCL